MLFLQDHTWALPVPLYKRCPPPNNNFDHSMTCGPTAAGKKKKVHFHSETDFRAHFQSAPDADPSAPPPSSPVCTLTKHGSSGSAVTALEEALGQVGSEHQKSVSALKKKPLLRRARYSAYCKHALFLPQFLAMLPACRRAIGKSSSMERGRGYINELGNYASCSTPKNLYFLRQYFSVSTPGPDL